MGRGDLVKVGVSPVTPDRPTASGAAPAGALTEDLGSLESALQVAFRDRTLLLTALTHPSFANEHPQDSTPTNERLEFLGDAVLGTIVAEALYARFPDLQEGRLTEWRAALVCGPTLSRVATDVIALGPWLRLGRGEEHTGGREREGNLERAYVAIVGAVYLDQGLEAARAFVERTLGAEFDALARDPGILNPKGTLQQITQDSLGRPEYVIVDQEGPEHDRRYTVDVLLGGESLGRGRAGTKQEAEKEAARQALPKVRALLSEGTAGQPARRNEPPGAGEAGTTGGTVNPGIGS